MANVPESPTWVGGIYQLETTDKVRAGAGGIANRQAEQLANRTSYLNGKVEELDTNKQDKGQPSESAEKLSTPRNITLSGDATGSVEFDGSEDKNLPVTLADTGVTGGVYGTNVRIPVITVNSKGQITEASQVTADFLSSSEKGVPGGVPFLDGDGKIPEAQLPTLYGVNQTLTDLTSTRTVSTGATGTVTYTNTQDRPITIYVNSMSELSDARLVGYVDEVPASTDYAPTADAPIAISFNVPAGSTYSVFGVDLNMALNKWREYI